MIFVVHVVYTDSGNGVEQVPYFISKAFSFFLNWCRIMDWMDVGRFSRFWAFGWKGYPQESGVAQRTHYWNILGRTDR